MAFDYSNCRNTVNFSDLFTFVRSSVKNVYDRFGNLVEVSANQPAFSYDPVTGAPLGIDIEPSATNLLTYSEQLDNVAWIKTSATVTPNATTAPDGTMTADSFTSNSAISNVAGDIFTAGSFVYASRSFVAAITGNYTFSAFVKKKDLDLIQLRISDSPALSGTTSGSVIINLDNGNIVNTGGVSYTTSSAEYVGGGFYRVSLTAGLTAGLTYYLGFWFFNTTPVPENSNVGYYIWGAQLETGSVATSYIKTEATTQVRAADKLSIENIDTSAWFNPSEGTFVVEFELSTSDIVTASRVFGFSDGTTANRYLVSALPNGSVEVLSAAGSGTDTTQIAGIVGSEKTNVVIAARYNDSGFSASANGSAVATVAESAVATLNTAHIGSFLSVLYLNGTIKSIKYYPISGTDAQLQDPSLL